jgi:hypothetical protein
MNAKAQTVPLSEKQAPDWWLFLPISAWQRAAHSGSSRTWRGSITNSIGATSRRSLLPMNLPPGGVYICRGATPGAA